MIELLKKTDVIEAFDMKDGEIAVIVDWSKCCFIGKLVLRHKDSLIILTGNSDDSSPGFFRSREPYEHIYKVRLLNDGDTLIYTK